MRCFRDEGRQPESARKSQNEREIKREMISPQQLVRESEREREKDET